MMSRTLIFLWIHFLLLQVLHLETEGASDVEGADDNAEMPPTITTAKKTAINCYKCEGILSKTRSECNNISLSESKTNICHGFCYVRIIKPERKDRDVNIKRDCSSYKINNCLAAQNLDGEKTQICVRSCKTDLCNVGDSAQCDEKECRDTDVEPTKGASEAEPAKEESQVDQVKHKINCYQCSSSDKSGGDCSNASLADNTTRACHGFCVVRRYTPEKSDGQTIIERSCYNYKRDFCSQTENRDGEKYEMCIRSCSTDLCNTGDNSGKAIQLNFVLSSLLVLYSILLSE